MTQEQPPTSGNGNDIGGYALSLAAIAVSVIALLQSCSANRLSREANDLSAANLKIAETQLTVAYKPSLQASYYLGESPALDTPSDRAFIEGLGLSPTIIKSSYWRSAGTFSAPEQPGFLFILIANYGPGTAIRLSISGDWIPKEGFSPPVGLLDLEGSTPILPPGRFLAVLVDIVDSYDPVEVLANQLGTHFRALHLEVAYEDSTGMLDSLEVDAPDLPPALIEPGM